MSAAADLALECRGIGVRYGAVVALDDVSAGFARGRIHAVVGQNGAGKTSFARVCAGLVRPATGSLHILARQVATGDVGRARRAGVELVHQSFALPPSFTVAEAMEFGAARAGFPVYARRALERRWRPHLEALGVRVPAGRRVRELPVETQQAVEIARALVTEAKVLILDEPTAVLAPAGIEALFVRLRRLRETGVTVLLILHKIHEVLRIAETVTVLRGGRLVAGPMPIAATDAGRLAAAIIGGEDAMLSAADRAALVGAPAAALPEPQAAAPAGWIARLVGVGTQADADGPALDGVALSIGRGEIVGVAGVEGNGQRTLVRALAGLVPLAAGSIELAGADVTHADLLQRRALGLRIIPFERNAEGLSLSSSLWQNWAARGLLDGGLLAPIRPTALRAACRHALRHWDVRFASVDDPAGALSGGNAQKLILARELDAGARLIVAAQPTRGLDVGATAFVWHSLRAARAQGSGVLLISSDLDELFDVSDRLVVMQSGRIAGRFAPPYRLDAVGRAMIGAGATAGAAG